MARCVKRDLFGLFQNTITSEPQSVQGFSEILQFKQSASFHLCTGFCRNRRLSGMLLGQPLWTSFEPALGTVGGSIVAVGFRIERKNVPGAEGYVGPRREVDASIGIALGPDDTWEEPRRGRIMSEGLFDAGL